MAGLKKPSKKDNPNTILVIALVFFVLLSIGLGVFAYYGYDGQEKLRADAKAAKAAEKAAKDGRDQEEMGRVDGMIAIGVQVTPEELTRFKGVSDTFVREPDKFPQEVRPKLLELKKKNEGFLGAFLDAEGKYPTTYEAKLTAALDEAKKSKAQFETTQKDFEEYKKNTEAEVAKHEKAVKDLQALIAKGNADTVAAASKTNSQFPNLQKAFVKAEADRKDEQEKSTKEIADRDDRIARQNVEIEALKKNLNERSLGGGGGGAAGGGGYTEVHALMIDVSRGLPLWDRPLGKIFRVDPANLLVYIDIGSRRGILPETTFQVFASNSLGEADKKLKGTVEVVRILDANSSVCRITSLYDDHGDAVPLTGGLGARAVRDNDNLLKEGDLLFNTWFEQHVAIAGNVNFVGYSADSPAAQSLQLQEFMHVLRKQRIVVDSYVNLLNGQIEGAITPRTRILIRGDIAPVNRTEEEQDRYKKILESFTAMRKQAVDQGSFLISAENFGIMLGYRPPQSQTAKEHPLPFRPVVPFAGQIGVGRPREPAPEVGAAPAPPAPGEVPPAEKKDEKKDDK